MSDEEDYLSDKFLVNTTASTSSPRTYSSLRKEAQKRSQLKNEQSRTKSRRQRELDSREEGLSRSLFERAEEEGLSSGNKALSIMMKMGFKPGQSLGQTDEDHVETSSNVSRTPPNEGKDDAHSSSKLEATTGPPTINQSRHKAEPLPLNEWAGKKGIGSLKRPPSPGFKQRVAKMAKMAEESSRNEFRNRAKQQYEENRAEGRLRPAQRTCITLDEKKGIAFNVLWLNPHDLDSFPEGLIAALTLHTTYDPRVTQDKDGSIESRLKQQMQADALHGEYEDGEDTQKKEVAAEQKYSSEVLEEAAQFLRLQARDRLELVLSYLREQYLYCFWCGTQYADDAEMKEACPGADEELHD